MVELNDEEFMKKFYAIYEKVALNHDREVISKKEFAAILEGIVDGKKSNRQIAIELLRKIYSKNIIDEDRHWVN